MLTTMLRRLLLPVLLGMALVAPSTPAVADDIDTDEARLATSIEWSFYGDGQDTVVVFLEVRRSTWQDSAPTGTPMLTVDGTDVPVPALDADGRTRVDIAPDHGTHTVTGTYTGDDVWAPSTGTTELVTHERHASVSTDATTQWNDPATSNVRIRVDRDDYLGSSSGQPMGGTVIIRGATGDPLATGEVDQRGDVNGGRAFAVPARLGDELSIEFSGWDYYPAHSTPVTVTDPRLPISFHTQNTADGDHSVQVFGWLYRSDHRQSLNVPLEPVEILIDGKVVGTAPFTYATGSLTTFGATVPAAPGKRVLTLRHRGTYAYKNASSEPQTLTVRKVQPATRTSLSSSYGKPGQAVRLTTEVADQSGAMTAAPLQVQARVGNGTWTTVDTGTSDTAGRYATTVRPTASTAYRTVVAPSPRRDATRAGTYSWYSGRSGTLKVSKGRTRRTATLTARVAPAGRALLQRQVTTGKRQVFTTVQTKQVTGGKAVFTVKRPKPARSHVYRVVVAHDVHGAAWTSPTRFITTSGS